MPLLSQQQVLNLKLASIPSPLLKSLALNLGLSDKGSAAELMKRILLSNPDELRIDAFIKGAFATLVEERRAVISDEDLKNQLLKVKTFSWGAVQGQLDQKIQAQYVRRIVRYDALLEKVAATLHDEVTNYVICTWFNHWTTILIEEHISVHSRVIPTVKNIKGIDIFFDGQPFDLKVTYLPREYDPNHALNEPSSLAVWMYENQGAQRFGDENRLFVVLLDRDHPERSWELKRDFDLVFEKIDRFFDSESVSDADQIVFSFGKKTYTTVSKVLLISK